MEDINRIKMVLFEKKRTSRWLSEQLGVTPSRPATTTISSPSASTPRASSLTPCAGKGEEAQKPVGRS